MVTDYPVLPRHAVKTPVIDRTTGRFEDDGGG